MLSALLSNWVTRMATVTYKNNTRSEPDYVQAAAAALHNEIIKENARRLRESLLPNWGRWWLINNIKPIDQATGYGRPSLSAIVMNYAPVQIKTGYHEEPPPEIDDEEALRLHELIKSLSFNYQRELYRYYTTIHDKDTPAQRKCRQRAVDALAESTNFKK